jgi:hypothetical protein
MVDLLPKGYHARNIVDKKIGEVARTQKPHVVSKWVSMTFQEERSKDNLGLVSPGSGWFCKYSRAMNRWTVCWYLSRNLALINTGECSDHRYEYKRTNSNSVNGVAPAIVVRE